MIAERIYNDLAIRAVLMDPDIFERISDDSRAELVIDVKRESWVAMKVDNAIVGVYCLHPLNRWTLQIHAHMLPKHRKEHAEESGRLILRWFLDSSDYLKIVAEIPEIFPDVLKFTKKFGFQEEGRNRQSLKKGGVLVDQIWLGITRPEVEHLFESAEQPLSD